MKLSLPQDVLHEHARAIYQFVNLYADREQGYRDLHGGVDVPLAAIHVLAAIYENPGSSGAQLAKLLFCTPSAISQNLTVLERRGCIRRESEKRSSKRKLNYPTEYGMQLCRDHWESGVKSMNEIFSQLLQECTMEEVESFCKVTRLCNQYMISTRKNSAISDDK